MVTGTVTVGRNPRLALPCGRQGHLDLGREQPPQYAGNGAGVIDILNADDLSISDAAGHHYVFPASDYFEETSGLGYGDHPGHGYLFGG